MSVPGSATQHAGRRLAKRTLPGLLTYKFLHEYGYDKGEVVVAAIVEDIATVVRNYFTKADELEPGQMTYWCPSATERARKGKTMAHTKLVPVRLTLVAQEDIDALVAGVGALERREIRLRRLTHEAFGQGGVLAEVDLGLLTGYTDGGVSGAVSRLRKKGEILPIRGYVADMGSWPTHKAAIIRLYLEGLTTPEIASRTYHAKKSVDRYIEGFERVRLLRAKHEPEELPVLTGMSRNVVAQYLAIMEEHELGVPVARRRRINRRHG